MGVARRACARLCHRRPAVLRLAVHGRGCARRPCPDSRPIQTSKRGRSCVAERCISAAFGLPLLPVSAAEVAASVNETVAETVGWPELARQIRDVHSALPSRRPGERDRARWLLWRGRRARLLPRAVRPAARVFASQQLCRFWPADQRQCRRHCGSLPRTTACAVLQAVRRPSGAVDNRLDVVNEMYDTPIFVCRGLRSAGPLLGTACGSSPSSLGLRQRSFESVA